MQRYYSQTFHEYLQINENVSFSARSAITQIFTKTRDSTPTFTNRDLALLDIDKIISFNTGSLRQQGDRVRSMQMVAQLMQEEPRREETTLDVVTVLELLSRHSEDGAVELMRGNGTDGLQDPTIDVLRL